MNADRATLRRIWSDLLPVLDPGSALRAAVRREGDLVHLPDGDAIELATVEDVRVVAFGKAAPAMARAALPLLHGLPVRGLCACPAGSPGDVAPLRRIDAGHPLPDQGSAAAAAAALELLATTGPRDLVLFLVSGGGSALLEQPLPGLTEADLRLLHDLLVRSGAPIGSMNAVRKHCSAVKGGRLAVAAARALRQITLFVSDVPPDQPAAVASGPSLPDPTTWSDARAVLHGLPLPAPVQAFLARPDLPETPKAHDPAFARASWHCLLDSARAGAFVQERLRQSGCPAVLVDLPDDTPVARAAGLLLERLAAERRAAAEGPLAIVSTGELSCPLPPAHGRGGRNQQFALECASRIQGQPIAVLSAGTDGIDGNSPAAGAVVDGTTVDRARTQGRDVAAALGAFDAFPLLQALGDAIVTGPSGTNVRDVRVLLHG